MNRPTAFLALSLLLASATPGSEAAVCTNPGQFGPPVSHTTGPNPLFIATGDFNEDGKTDLAVTNSDFPTLAPVGSVSILLSTGGFGFAAPVNYAVGSVPHGIVSGDFNGDGILDLAVSNKFSNTISILRGNGSGGNGDGTFSNGGTVPTNFHPFQLVTADFNEDGILDLATSMNNSTKLGVMLGQGSGGVGNGAFAGPVFYSLNAPSTGIATADFNGDGILDLVATENVAGTIEVRLGVGTAGVGDGTFGAATHYAAGPEPFDFAVDDFNGDGAQDIAVANASYGGTLILNGTGSGTFLPPTVTLSSGNTASVASLDANGDGIRDLVTGAVTGEDTGSLMLFLGAGGGTFQPGTTVQSGRDHYQTTPVDLNADGKPDLITSDYIRDFIQVFPGACVAAPADPRKPVLTDVRDVPHDQGGKVFLTWTRSSLDAPGGPVVNYRVWRRVPSAFAAARQVDDESAASWRTTASTRLDGSTAIEYWEPVATLPAQRLAGYGYTAATSSDSSDAWLPYEAFFVSALTNNIDTFYDSNVDSGYSVDNIPPAAPAGLAGLPSSGGYQLQWQANAESDLRGYRVYRGTNPGFACDATSLVASPEVPTYTDGTSGWYFYRVAAVDKNGNESPFSEASSPSITGVDPATLVFALHGATPNPATGDNLRITFSLPSAEPATVLLVNIAGRTLASRALRSPTPGAQSLTLSGARGLPAGIYLVHLTQGGRSAVQKVVISH